MAMARSRSAPGCDLLHQAEPQGLACIELVFGQQIALRIAPAGPLDQAQGRSGGAKGCGSGPGGHSIPIGQLLDE